MYSWQKAVFNWIFKVIPDCFGFLSPNSVICQENLAMPLSQSIKCKTKNQSQPGQRHIPALQAVNLFLLWVLNG